MLPTRLYPQHSSPFSANCDQLRDETNVSIGPNGIVSGQRSRRCCRPVWQHSSVSEAVILSETN